MGFHSGMPTAPYDKGQQKAKPSMLQCTGAKEARQCCCPHVSSGFHYKEAWQEAKDIAVSLLAMQISVATMGLMATAYHATSAPQKLLRSTTLPYMRIETMSMQTPGHGACQEDDIPANTTYHVLYCRTWPVPTHMNAKASGCTQYAILQTCTL